MALSDHNDEALGRILRAKLIGVEVCMADARKAIDKAMIFRNGALDVLVELRGRLENQKQKEKRHG